MLAEITASMLEATLYTIQSPETQTGRYSTG